MKRTLVRALALVLALVMFATFFIGQPIALVAAVCAACAVYAVARGSPIGLLVSEGQWSRYQRQAELRRQAHERAVRYARAHQFTAIKMRAGSISRKHRQNPSNMTSISATSWSATLRSFCKAGYETFFAMDTPVFRSHPSYCCG